MTNRMKENFRGNLFLLDEGGLPSDKPLWRVSREDFGSIMEEWVLHENRLFIAPPKGTSNWCLDLESGETLWQKKVRGNSGVAAAVHGELVCLGRFLHHCETGEIVGNLKNWIDGKIYDYFQALFDDKGLYLRLSGKQPCLVRFDLDQRCGERLNFDLMSAQLSNERQYIVGWHGYRLECWDLETQHLIWFQEVPADISGHPLSNGGFALLDDEVFLHTHIEDIMVLRLKTGEVVRTKEGKKLDSSQKYNLPGASHKIAVSDSVCIMSDSDFQQGYVAALDSRDLRELWRIQLIEPRPPKILGDLAFCIHGEHSQWVSALDIYSGEIKWTTPEPLIAAVWLLAWDNKVIISSPVGEFICYQWDHVYRSPGKDGSSGTAVVDHKM